MRPIYIGWMIAAFPIGWAISRLVFTVVFYGVFTPVALWFRATGRDVLHLGRAHGGGSYWTPKPRATRVEQYFRQS